MSRASSAIVFAGLLASASAHPYPACEPCDAVTQADLDALTAVGKVSKDSRVVVVVYLSHCSRAFPVR